MTARLAGVPEVLARARELAAAGRRTMIGITGPPGSGKSTLAARVLAELGSGVVVVPMDGFHLAQAELVRLGREDRKGAPDTFDAAGYAALLERVRAGEPLVYAPTFDRRLEEPVAGAIAVPADVPLVVTEGNYLLLDEPSWERARACLDEVWFVDSDPVVRVERLVARHVRHGRTEQAARSWVLSSDERNAELVETTRRRADLVVTPEPEETLR